MNSFSNGGFGGAGSTGGFGSKGLAKKPAPVTPEFDPASLVPAPEATPEAPGPGSDLLVAKSGARSSRSMGESLMRAASREREVVRPTAGLVEGEPVASMRFFFYGTLLDGSDNPVADEIHALLEPIGAAWVDGMLHAIPDPQGWFPALMPGKGRVNGRIYQTRSGFDTAALARIDGYEDFDPADPQASLYVRRELPVVCAGLDTAAQIYVWNRPLPEDARPIPDGDFADWLGSMGVHAFRGVRGG